MTGTQGVEKVYSVDKKIWVGMKTADANKSEEDMKVFNFADRERNGEISEPELTRYNGPLLIENFPERKGRIIGHAGRLPLDAMYLEDNEVDYYPGLKIEDVNSPEGRIVYHRIDREAPKGVLSKEEMETVVDVKEKLDSTEQKLEKIQSKRMNLSVVGMAGSVALLYRAIIASAKYNSRTGAIAWGVGAAIGAGLTLANRLVAKSKAKQEIERLQQETNNHPYLNGHVDRLKSIV